MEKIKVYFLHGFLGSPNDWNPVLDGLKNLKNIECEAIDLFKAPWSPELGLQEWGVRFCDYVQNNSLNKAIVVGYSMGARLGMTALRVRPELFSKVILISGNPGFDDSHMDLNPESEARRTRWIQDSNWADKFMKSPWEEVVTSWNVQPVFRGGKVEPVRLENEYNRDTLALALTQWSLSQQPNMRTVLAENVDKVLWIVGENDERYRQLSMELKAQFSKLKVLIASGASHRVVFDNPEYIMDLVEALSRS